MDTHFNNFLIEFKQCSKPKFIDVLTSSKINLQTFGSKMIQFYQAVEHWPQFLQKIMDKCQCKTKCLACQILLDNILDESGDKSEPHTATFEDFLQQFGCIKSDPTSDLIKYFNNYLDELAEINPLNAILCAHGIELTYVKISTLIKNYCEENKIHQKHYDNHEVIDIEHAAELKRAAEFIANRDLCEINEEFILIGSALIMFVFEKMLED
jgi:hypothetical protein